MRCVIAKTNPVLMDKAIIHYLNPEKCKESPLFRFMSLFDDEEPYPLPELIQCLNERIDEQQALFKEYPTDSTSIHLGRLKRNRRELLKLVSSNNQEQK